MYWWVIVQDDSQYIIRRFSSERYAGIYASAWGSSDTQVRIFRPDEWREVAEELHDKLKTAAVNTKEGDEVTENPVRRVQP